MRHARLLVLSAMLPLGLAAQVRVEPTPTATFGATSEAGDLRFTTAAWATRLSSGEVAVADLAEAAVRILGPDGALRRTLGRRGAGPGEFGLPIWIGRCRGDSLTIWDAAARVTTYAAAARATDAPTTRTVSDAASSLHAACASDGRLALLQGMQPRRDVPPVATGESPNGGQYTIAQMAAALITVDSAGAVQRVRESISQGHWVVGRLGPQGGSGGVPRPLAPATYFAFAGGTLVLADAGTGEVSGLAADGRDAFRFSAAGPARRVTPADYDRAVTSAVALVPAPMREAATAFVRSVPPPTEVPHFWRVLTDPEGLIWLVVSPVASSETRFRVYTTTGRLVAEPRIAGAVIPFEVGTDYLLGKRENGDGEDELVVWRVSRTR